jgi:hypothetical protein
MKNKSAEPAVVVFFKILFGLTLLVFSGTASAQKVFHGNPKNYRDLLRQLRAGDTLILEPGIYDEPHEYGGLPIFKLNGEPGKPIVITGPDSDPRPVFPAESNRNTIRIANSSYIVIRNLELDGRQLDVDGVRSQDVSHHILLENLLIKDHANVGISTKAAAWDWTIRGCVILRAGTGMYLGNSDGTAPFVRGFIENNLIADTRGYSIQIKQQNPRPDIPGMPTAPSATTIRHNVFSKAENGAVAQDARPNVLVGHFPLAGPGGDDVYQIYGNFFYQNPTGQPLFQGEGNIALYNNLLLNAEGDAIWIQPHNAFPRMVRVFFNTIIARNKGIWVQGGSETHRQMVIGNAVFAGMPILANDQRDNLTASFRDASRFLRNPTGPLGALDLYPRPARLRGKLIDTSSFQRFLEWNLDFNGLPRSKSIRGAYGAEGSNPGWLPKLDIKPTQSSVAGARK